MTKSKPILGPKIITYLFHNNKLCLYLGNEANNNDVNDELNEIRQKHQEKIDKSKHQSWAWILKRIFSNAFLKPFSCVGSLYLITTWHGFNCIMVYMISVLNDTGSSFDIRLLETLGK